MIKRQFQFLGSMLALSLILSVILFWLFERHENKGISSLGDIIWWWIVTSTTVGYGDIAPITLAGRIAGVVSILTGIYCYTVFISLTHDKVHEYVNRARLGTAQINFKDHIVICEYTAFADELLQVLPYYLELVNRNVVVVSDLVGVNPYPHYHFVRGVPISPAALQQANISEAAYIFVFSNVRFQEPDLKTLHTVSRVQKLNNRAKIFVEMHNPQSPFTRHLNRAITVLNSRHLLESILQNATLDLSAHFTPTSAAELRSG
jgi:voltage-gated potassium channel